MTKITLLFCLFTTAMLSQNVTGTLYDSEAPISGSKIMNISSKSIATTDNIGSFKLYAKVNDTLIFSSLFHHTKQLIVNALLLEGVQVFELKKIVNELDEIELYGPIIPREMDGKEATEKINKQFKTDVEKNPHLYRRPNANSGPIDFMEIGRRIVKLFESKTPKEPETTETRITSDDLDRLFKSDTFFNDTFLVLDLNITKDNKHLFFAYCETKEISSSLLRQDNKIYLIDKFLDYGAEFREILKESLNH